VYSSGAVVVELRASTNGRLSARGERVCESRELRLEAEIFTDPKAVEHCFEWARFLRAEPSGGAAPTDANSVARSGVSSSTTL